MFLAASKICYHSKGQKFKEAQAGMQLSTKQKGSLQALPQRTDGKLYRIQTPQTPIARTQAYERYNMDEFPNGTNMIVAVLAYTGNLSTHNPLSPQRLAQQQ